MQETQETQVWSLGGEDPPGGGNGNPFSILAWKIPWTEESGRLQSMGSPRVQHTWVAEYTHIKVTILVVLKILCILLRMIALQCCVGFCHTATRICHRYTYVLPSWTSLPPPTPLGCPEPWVELPVSYSKSPLATYFAYGVNPSHPFLPQLCPQVLWLPFYCCPSVPFF